MDIKEVNFQEEIKSKKEKEDLMGFERDIYEMALKLVNDSYLYLQKSMWEVFIPRSSDAQTIFHIANHRECQQKIKEQTSAEIILCDTKHMPWKSIDNGNFFEYDTFPIRIVCDTNKISDVLNIIKEHYNMSKIYAYQVSDKLIESS